MRNARFRFDPMPYERQLAAIIAEIRGQERLDARSLDQILRRHPKDGRGFFAKSEILAGARHLARREEGEVDEARLIEKLRTAPVRTRSGVAPVTVLTRPHPCPGRCIFCPNDVRMPKSYLADEPGAQRAAAHRFDPYGQTSARLEAFRAMGHRLDKVELIVLGGTWSFYPEEYRIWFLTRCFEALNDFGSRASGQESLRDDCFASATLPAVARGSYNRTVARHLRQHLEGRLTASWEQGSWEALEGAQRHNESARARCVGLSLETRPDALSEVEVIQLRRSGATKIQLGIQSLSDAVLSANARGHDVAASRRAVALLRSAGFKIQAHWMANLRASTPAGDVHDFERLFADPDFRPDELKIYPCSLIEGTELMEHHRAGSWRPYSDEELLFVVTECMARAPRYCRLTRVVRDIPSTDIVVGNRHTNFREIAERELRRCGRPVRDIRAREVRDAQFRPDALALRETAYETGVGRELFLEFATPEDRIVAFLRLFLPKREPFVGELSGSALIREVHVYGELAALGQPARGRPQHGGLGRRLVAVARARAEAAGFSRLSVISAVGTRPYYRRLGFRDGRLYQHLRLAS